MKNTLLPIGLLFAAVLGAGAALLSGCTDESAAAIDAGIDSAVELDLSHADLVQNVDAAGHD